MKNFTLLLNNTPTRIKKSCGVLLAAGLSILAAQSAYADGGHNHGDNKDPQKNQHHQQESSHDHGNHASPVGSPAAVENVTKTIRVTMFDSMKYTFSEELNLQPGEVVRFIVTNQGKLAHEFSIGNAEEQRRHAEMMRKMPDMQHVDGNTISLKGGATSELIWQFKGNQEVVFACNIPGHFEAGMFAKTKLKKQHDDL